MSDFAPHTKDAKSLSVVLPAYNERDNIGPLIDELIVADSQDKIKRIVVVDDDSPDNLAEYLKAQRFKKDVLCIHRINRHGLSSAVLEGVMLSDTEYVAIMDSDGQHAPQDLMLLLDAAEARDLDIVIGSRFLKEKTNLEHRGMRRTISTIGNKIVNLLTGHYISDPLTGFFLIRRTLAVQLAREIRPHGFKILFDILYSSRKKRLNLEEIQINFRPRRFGESKLDSAVVLEFIEQVFSRLTHGIIPERFLGFSLVGGSGVAVHLAVLYFLHLQFSADFLQSHTVATIVAMIWNYTLNNRITFRRFRKKGLDWFLGLCVFCAISSIGALSNVGVAGLLNASEFVWWTAALAGVFVGTVFNFALSRFVVWR